MRVRSWSRAHIQCVKIFTVQKKFVEKIFTNSMHWWNWRKFFPGKNFHVYGNWHVCVHPRKLMIKINLLRKLNPVKSSRYTQYVYTLRYFRNHRHMVVDYVPCFFPFTHALGDGKKTDEFIYWSAGWSGPACAQTGCSNAWQYSRACTNLSTVFNIIWWKMQNWCSRGWGAYVIFKTIATRSQFHMQLLLTSQHIQSLPQERPAP